MSQNHAFFLAYIPLLMSLIFNSKAFSIDFLVNLTPRHQSLSRPIILSNLRHCKYLFNYLDELLQHASSLGLKPLNIKSPNIKWHIYVNVLSMIHLKNSLRFSSTWADRREVWNAFLCTKKCVMVSLHIELILCVCLKVLCSGPTFPQ